MTSEGLRTDWALVLPVDTNIPASDVIVLGGSDARARHLVEAGIALRWRRPTGPDDTAELVVARHDAGVGVEEVVRHLGPGPGATAVIEIDRKQRGSRRLDLRAVDRRLGASGARRVSAHMVAPSFAAPSRFLPLDHPRALRWYLRTLVVAATPSMRAAQIAAAAVLATPGASRIPGALTSRILVVARRALGSDAGAPPLGSPHGRPGDRVLVLTSGYDPASRAVALPFASAASRPTFVVKVAASASAAAGTIGEHDRLSELQTSLPVDLARSLPVPLETTTVAGQAARVQTCADGRSMSASIAGWGRSARRRRRDLDDVADWLSRFGVATRVEAANGDTASWMATFDAFTREVAVPARVTELTGAAARAAVSSGLAGFSVEQHHDSGPWNVYVGRRPFMIDWELDALRPSGSVGPALADVLYLATYWYFQTQGVSSPDDEPAALVELFGSHTPGNQGARAVRSAVDRALQSAALPRTAVPAALGALWAERAVYTRRRRFSLEVPLQDAASRPEVFLDALTSADLFDENGWWGDSRGR